MNLLRIISGLGSLGIATVLAFHLVVAFRPLILPTLRQLGEEPTTYFVMRVAGFSLSGWQILVFEFGLVVICFIAAVVGIYALSGSNTKG